VIHCFCPASFRIFFFFFFAFSLQKFYHDVPCCAFLWVSGIWSSLSILNLLGLNILPNLGGFQPCLFKHFVRLYMFLLFFQNSDDTHVRSFVTVPLSGRLSSWSGRLSSFLFKHIFTLFLKVSNFYHSILASEERSTFLCPPYTAVGSIHWGFFFFLFQLLYFFSSNHPIWLFFVSAIYFCDLLFFNCLCRLIGII